MAQIKKGDAVQLVQPVIQGTVIKTEYDEDGECLKHLVEYPDAYGDLQQRWFVETSLQPV